MPPAKPRPFSQPSQADPPEIENGVDVSLIRWRGCAVDDFNPDFLSMLRILVAHKVDFIVVGGVSGGLAGCAGGYF